MKWTVEICGGTTEDPWHTEFQVTAENFDAACAEAKRQLTENDDASTFDAQIDGIYLEG